MPQRCGARGMQVRVPPSPSPHGSFTELQKPWRVGFSGAVGAGEPGGRGGRQKPRTPRGFSGEPLPLCRDSVAVVVLRDQPHAPLHSFLTANANRGANFRRKIFLGLPFWVWGFLRLEKRKERGCLHWNGGPLWGPFGGITRLLCWLYVLHAGLRDEELFSSSFFAWKGR